MTEKERTLVLVAHGSHEGPAPRQVVHRHADRVRATGVFDEVREAFWKSTPSITDALRAVRTDEAVVVPFFMSEGYFADEVVPAELQAVPKVDVKYVAPVGTHPSVAETVKARADGVVEEDENVALAVVAHGTNRHAGSSTSAEKHARRLEGSFEESHALFLDQEPNVSKLPDMFESDTVVAAPLFVADGPHVREDVPEAMGIDPEAAESSVEGTSVRYTDAVGTYPNTAEVILRRAGEVVDIDVPTVEDKPSSEDVVDGYAVGEAERSFLCEVDEEITVLLGQIAVTAVSSDGEERRYELRHVDDREGTDRRLTTHDDPRKAREITSFDGDGEYRPLLWERTLRSGWLFEDLGPAETIAALEGIYPGSIRLAYRNVADDESVGLEEIAERHEIYGALAESEGVEDHSEAFCSACVRRRLWNGFSVTPDEEGDIPCHEPCSVLASAIRRRRDKKPNKSKREIQ